MACSKLFKFSDFGTVKKQKFARRGIVLKTFYGQENTENIFRTIVWKLKIFKNKNAIQIIFLPKLDPSTQLLFCKSQIIYLSKISS